MTLRIGLAGYGRRGRGHIRAVNEIPEARISAVTDPVETAREAATNELEGVAVHTTVAAMVDSGDVDAVIVAAPAHLNGDVAVDAIERGIPVLVEKPPALSVDAVMSLRKTASRSGSKVMVAFNRRFNPLIQTAIDVVKEAGPLRQIVAEFHKDIHEFTDDPRISPTMMDLMLMESPIHSVDIVTHFADSPVKTVNAIVKRTVSGLRDVHAALVEFDNEVVCQLTAAYTSGGRLERYELHGDYVSVYLEGVQKGWILKDGNRSKLTADYEPGIDTLTQARHFVRSVIDDVDYPPPAATLGSSIATLRLCENIINAVD